MTQRFQLRTFDGHFCVQALDIRLQPTLFFGNRPGSLDQEQAIRGVGIGRRQRIDDMPHLLLQSLHSSRALSEGALELEHLRFDDG
jgi:hypothetical protein